MKNNSLPPRRGRAHGRRTDWRGPRWWDAENEFPPNRPVDAAMAAQIRRHFFWRFGLFAVLFFSLLCGLFTCAFWLLASAVNAVSVPPGVNSLVRPLGIGALILGILMAAFTFRAIRRAVVPLSDVISAAEQVRDGDYSVRVEPRGPREVRGLGTAFNEMTERLQANDLQRRRLLADVSHELRTPLTVIQGNLEGMLDGVYPLDPAHLAPVLDETRQLSRLIDDLRTLALAESGELHLQREMVDPAALVNETVNSFRAQADAANISLTTEAASNLPSVDADPGRIRQVLENLLYNALRFTERGGAVTVSCTADARDLTIAVQDTGRGIPAEELPHIFERFTKARDSVGTGLGLAIARSIVEAHGGEIFAESAEGKGTRIWFTLPTGKG